MNYISIIKAGMLAALVCLAGCKEETLTAEVPVPGTGGGELTGETRFVLPQEEGMNTHVWKGEDLTFELRRGMNDKREITAAFDTDEETLNALTAKYAELKGINLYKLLSTESYEVPQTVTLAPDKASVSVPVKIKDVKEGTFVLPLVLKNGEHEIGVQFVEVVRHPEADFNMSWLDRTPSVEEPRFVAIIETAENDIRNVGNYVLYPNGEEQADTRRPLFDMTVIFSANINWNGIQGKPELYYNESVRRILDNRDVFVKPLQDRGIKVLLSLMPNHQAIGFSNLDITGERSMIKGLARDIQEAVQTYGLDGVMFDDEYANYPETPEAEQPGRPMVQMGSFHFLIKELRDLMPIVEGQAWKDRHNLITLYNTGPFTNGAGNGWCLFGNKFDLIKKHAAGWEDERYGNPIAEDKKAVREWIKDPVNQAVLEEIGKIEVGRLFDYVWNANYLRGDNHQYSFSSGRTSDTWIAGLSGEDAEKKYGVASFEMSLENDYGRIQHQTRFWEQGEGKRNEALTTTIGKQKTGKHQSIICFNLQYVPDTWKDAPYTNLYLQDFPLFMKQLGNTANPVVKFEGVNYDTLLPAYMK